MTISVENGFNRPVSGPDGVARGGLVHDCPALLRDDKGLESHVNRPYDISPKQIAETPRADFKVRLPLGSLATAAVADGQLETLMPVVDNDAETQALLELVRSRWPKSMAAPVVGRAITREEFISHLPSETL